MTERNQRTRVEGGSRRLSMAKTPVLLSSTALVPALAVLAAVSVLAAPGAALAQQSGGNANNGLTGFGGAGGVSSDVGAGGAGQSGGGTAGSLGGGGGGGAGATGGAGGSGATGAAGGAGGATPGAAGQAGANDPGNIGAGGGGGGAHGFIDFPFMGSTTGGAGGAGGATTAANGFAGGGGGGGFGGVYTLAGTFSTSGNAISGGAGGAGGGASTTTNGSGGDGGTGGAGLVFTRTTGGSVIIDAAVAGGSGGAGGAGGAGPIPQRNGVAGAGGIGLRGQNLIISVTTSGSITGGNSGSFSGPAVIFGAAGGAGIVGSNITLNNRGTIAGGLGGNGVRASALQLSGDNTILNVGTLTGGIENASGYLTFDLLGDGQIAGVVSGAGNLVMSGNHTLSLLGANTYSGTTTIDRGTIALDAGGTIGTGALQFSIGSSGQLLSQSTRTLANAIEWLGGSQGTIAAATGSTLTLTGAVSATSFPSGGPLTSLRFGSAAAGGTVVFNPASLNLTQIGGTATDADVTIAGGTLRALGTGSDALFSKFKTIVDAGATLELRGANVTVRDLSGSGTVTNQGGVTTLGGGAFAGTLSGTQAVTVAGDVTLSGANTYSGGTTVSSGRLVLDSASGGIISAAGSGGINLSADTLLQSNVTGTLQNGVDTGIGHSVTIGAAAGTTLQIAGSFAMKSGPGKTLTFGSSSLTGTIALTPAGITTFGGTAGAVAGGTLRVGSAATLSGLTGGFTVGTGATTAALDLNGVSPILMDFAGNSAGIVTNNGTSAARLFAGITNATTFAGVIKDGTSATGLYKFYDGTLTLSGNNTFSGTTTIETGTLQIGDGGTTGSLGSGAVTTFNDTTLAFNRSDDITVGNIIGGLGGLSKQGAGALTLTGANSFSGGLLVSQGTVVLSSANAGTINAAGTGTIALSGGSSLIGATSGTIANSVQVGSGGATIGAATGTVVRLASPQFRFDAPAGSPLAFGSATATGTIELAPVAVSLGAASNAVRIDGGTLRLANDNAYALLNAASGITLNGAALGADASGTLSPQLAVTAAGGTIDVAAASLTLQSGLALAGGLTKTGSGELALSAPGSGSATVRLDAGTLALLGTRTRSGSWGSGALQMATGTTLRSAASFVQLNNAIVLGGGSGSTIAGPAVYLGGPVSGGQLNVAAGASIDDRTVVVLFGNNSYGATTVGANSILAIGNIGTSGTLGSGPVSLGAGARLVTSRRDDYLLANAISGSGILQIAGQKLIVSGNNSFSGGTLQFTGQLELASSNALGTGSLAMDRGTVLTTADGVSSTIVGPLVVMRGSVGISAASGQLLTVQGGMLIDPTVTTIDFGAVGKTGTILLGAPQSTQGGFAGTINVNSGTLLVNGALGDVTNPGATINVASGAKLGGSGTLGGAVTLNAGATLAPGNSPGTLTMAGLTLNAGSTSIFELGQAGIVGGPDNDLVRVTGNLALNGGTIQISRGAGFGTGQYTLFEYGSLSGGIGNLTLNPLGGGYIGGLALGTGTVVLTAATASDLVYWNGSTTSPNGTIVGGDGIWNLTNGNFTNASGGVSAAWAGNGNLAVFGGNGGTVTLAAGEVLSPAGLNFLADGYVINGGDAAAQLALAGPTGIDTAAGVGATINAVISGSGALTKTGNGSLTLARIIQRGGDEGLAGVA